MKKIAPLTDVACRNAKPGFHPRTGDTGGKPYKLFDGAGLYLEVESSGRKVWRFKFKHAGKESRIKLGTYPETPLAGFKDKGTGRRIAGARELHAAERRLLSDGVSPSQRRRDAETRKKFQSANTFSALAGEWLAMKADPLSPKPLAPVTHAKARWMLETFAYPFIGDLPLAEIKPSHVLKALRDVQSRGNLETTHRLKGRISEVFRFAIADDRAESDPCRDLRGQIRDKRPPKHHAALMDPREIGALLRAIDAYTGTPETRAALKLAPLLFVRPGELRAAQWSDFELDSERPAWRYYVSKTKTDHIVPLCTQAVAILRDLHRITGAGITSKPGGPRYVFPGARTLARPMSENTVNAALRRLGYTKEQMTGHGFRAMARTLLAEMGWQPDVIERQLAHKASGPLGAAYDRAQYLEERRRMMQAWADYLDSLARGESKVVPLRAA